MKQLGLLVGVLICAAAVFSGCEPMRSRDGSRVSLSIAWSMDPDHDGYYIPSDHHHHGDRDHLVYRYTPVWRGDSDHPGYYIPRDRNKHGDRNHPVYNDNHRGDGNNSQSRDGGERAILQYCAQNALPVHISSIVPLTEQTPPGATAQTVKRYKVIDAAAGTETVVAYNPTTGALALE